MNTPDHISAEAASRLIRRGPIIFMRLDKSGRVTEANTTARKLMGEDIIGAAAEEIFLTFGDPLDFAALSTGDDPIHLINVRTTTGLPETINCCFIPSGHGMLVFGGMDPAETGRLRGQLISLNNQLNALTRELQKKNHQLAELNRLKNQFLGMAAHDLRKPVSSILTYTEFLLDEAGHALNTEHFGFLKTIRASTALMRNLIDEFLDVSLIEAGRFHLNPEPAYITLPAERSLALNRLAAKRKGVLLRLDIQGKIPLIPLDGYKIEQVLNNLLSNAIDHTPPSSEVVIRIASTTQKVTVTVTDAGAGISENQAENLFMPYVSQRKLRTPDGKNMGLGLAISKKIIEAHHGEIWVESAPGRGAAFSFFIPVNTPEKGLNT